MLLPNAIHTYTYNVFFIIKFKQKTYFFLLNNNIGLSNYCLACVYLLILLNKN